MVIPIFIIEIIYRTRMNSTIIKTNIVNDRNFWIKGIFIGYKSGCVPTNCPRVSCVRSCAGARRQVPRGHRSPVVRDCLSLLEFDLDRQARRREHGKGVMESALYWMKTRRNDGNSSQSHFHPKEPGRARGK